MGNIPTGLTAPTLGINAVLSSVKAEFKIEASDSDIWLFKMINESVRHVDLLTLFQKKTAILDVKNNIACLPCGFYRMIALRFGQPPFCGTAIYVDIPFANSIGCCGGNVANGTSGIFAFSNSFQIQGSNIVFNQAVNFDINGNFMPDPITKCYIAYYGFDVDEDGLFNLYADMERAIVAYVCWKYARQNFKEYPTAVRNEYRQEWIAQKKWLKSNAYYNNFMDTRWQIAEQSNAILVDKFFTP